jgi:diguanylate cyclase (GGDEF)-like protein
MTDRMEPLKKLLRRSHLIGGEDISEDERWLILDELYDFKPIVTATLAVCLASLFAWRHGYRVESALWVATGLTVCVGRFFLSRAYRRRSPSASLSAWIDRFFVVALVTAVQWGLGGLVVAISQDGITSAAVYAVEAALMGGAASRGFAFPAAALLQVYIVSGMLIVPDLVVGQYMLALLMVLYAVHNTVFVSSVVKIKLSEIETERQNEALLLELKQTNADLARANGKLSEIATTDALTGIANRRSFDAELSLRWEQAVAARTPLSLLMVDVDHFKRFNDTHGHPVGDRCLELVAAAIASAATDPAVHTARYGGEEFALIIPNGDLPLALAVAERLQAAVRKLAVPVGEGRVVRVTASIGIGFLIPGDESGDELLVAMADQALYRAKQCGRDCIQVTVSSQEARPVTADVAEFGA